MKAVMKLYGILLFFLLLMPCAAQTYRNEIFAEDIRTLEVNKEGQWNANPVIVLNSGEKIHVSFDQLSHDYKRYAYRLIHCNADWTPSGLNELEYMEGFSLQETYRYSLSEGTLTDYTHYELEVPNDQLKLKLSGNYALLLMDRDRQEEILAVACFSVLERRISIKSEVSRSTDLGYNTAYQQLNFVLNTTANQIQRPESDLIVLVRQNRRLDNEVFGIQALMTSANEIRYEHLPELIFEGGNEYRRFEISSYKFSGLGVDKIRFQQPCYHAYLIESTLRNTAYSFDKDQNGRFYVRNFDADDNQQTEADYFWVHFFLKAPESLDETGVYLQGDFTYASFGEPYKMKYNPQSGCYEKSLFLKQGAYNYMYLSKNKAVLESTKNLKTSASSRAYRTSTISAKKNPGTTFPVEGSFWETENEYQIFVYYRPVGADYDALIAYDELSSQL